uniref:Ig-like domain-containing protein n=1 Tax=Nothobranchius furzeri TaxID=105023 RepID=A0A8C6Q7C9_NOTFU
MDRIYTTYDICLSFSPADLFIVEAEQTAYVSEYGGNVVMGCKFNAKPSDPQNSLKVTWHWRTSSQYLEVIQLSSTMEQSTSPRYQDRAKMLLNELKHGWAKLQVLLSDLKINDSGTYECLVQTEKGTDYKTITLSVKAPFKSISKHVEKSANGDKVLLTCESEGYPESPVMWMDGHSWKRADDATTTTTPDHLIKITSRIQVSSSEKNNYTCNFTRDGHSATFHIPDDIPTPPGTNGAVIVVFSLCLILTVVAVIIYRHRKGN